MPPPPPPQTTDDTDDYLPTADPPHDQTHHCFAAAFEPTGKIYSDLTGKFIAPSSTGNNYILVMYDFDSNAILTVPMKNRSQQSHTDAFCLAHQRLVRASLRPRLQILDNECSTMLKTFMLDQDLDFQLVPPYLHRRNAAERAICTFKNHCIAGLCSTDPAFPIHLWDRLLPRLNSPSTYSSVPASTQNSQPGPNSTAPLESYRCHTVWIAETRRERITDTISFFPKSVALPLATPDDLIHASLQNIINILKKPTSLSTPYLSTSNLHALEQLAEIFSPNSPTRLRVATKAPPSPGPSPPGTPRQSNLQPVPASPLRVPTEDLPPLPNLPDPVPASPRAAGPTDITTAPSDATFPNLTGPAARNRQRRTPKKSAMTSRKSPIPTPMSPAKEPAHSRNRPTLPPTLQPPPLKSSCSMLPSLSLTTSHFTAMPSTLTPEKLPSAPNSVSAATVPTGKLPMLRKLGALPKATNTSKVPTPSTLSTKTKSLGTKPQHTFALSVPIVPKRKTLTMSDGRPHAIHPWSKKFMSGDLKDFYLGTPMAEYEYMRIHWRYIPDDIFEQYNLSALLDGDFTASHRPAESPTTTFAPSLNQPDTTPLNIRQASGATALVPWHSPLWSTTSE
ncbi:hypothetical protein IV203_018672 [Nitzschia inconspicua]|uniref:Uncharacterized protein n=1 Tax=Nitzschia inconspicua TaxID=303405 RepID=A0A9K3M1T5_9STRA|nr:hypothetical protein IV203_018672 [Nitzschia inconspicua]